MVMYKSIRKILALVLAAAMVTGIIPFNIVTNADTAADAADSYSFVISVQKEIEASQEATSTNALPEATDTDAQSKYEPVTDAVIIYEVWLADEEGKKTGEKAELSGRIKENKDGEYTISISGIDIKDYWIYYTVIAEGFAPVSGQQEITEDKAEIILSEKGMPVTVEIEGLKADFKGSPFVNIDGISMDIEKEGKYTKTVYLSKEENKEAVIIPDEIDGYRLISVSYKKKDGQGDTIVAEEGKYQYDAAEEDTITIEYGKTYTVSVAAVIGGTVKISTDKDSIESSDKLTVLEGTSVYAQVTKDDHYELEKLVDEEDNKLTDTDGIYEISNITKDKTITASFKHFNNLTIQETAIDEETGTICIRDDEGTLQKYSGIVQCGDYINKYISVEAPMPDESKVKDEVADYYISSITITGGDIIKEDTSTAKSITVNSKKWSGYINIGSSDVTVSITYTHVYKINFEIGENGEITAEGDYIENIKNSEGSAVVGNISGTATAQVIEGGDIKLSFVPAEGYKLGKLTVDGTEVDVENNAYTIKAVKGKKDIKVTFIKKQYAVTLVSGEGVEKLEFADGSVGDSVNVYDGDSKKVKLTLSNKYNFAGIILKYKGENGNEKEDEVALNAEGYCVTRTGNNEFSFTVPNIKRAESVSIKTEVIESIADIQVQVNISESSIKKNGSQYYFKDTISVSLDNSNSGTTIKGWRILCDNADEEGNCDKLGAIEFTDTTKIVGIQVFTDAGKWYYVNKDGITLTKDTTNPDLSILNQDNSKFTGGIFNSDVKIKVSATDNESGIKEIRYKIGDEQEITVTNDSNGKGFSCDIPSISIETYNGCCDIPVKVTVKDMCGNELPAEEVFICMDKNAPEVTVNYYQIDDKGNETESIADNTYYGKRKAEITIKERGHHLDISSVTVKVKDRDTGSIENYNFGDKIVIDKLPGDKSYDDEDEHIGHINFLKDGNYTITIDGFTDKAGQDASFDGDKKSYSYDFTIDTQGPEITVTSFDGFDENSDWIAKDDVKIYLLIEDKVSNIKEIKYTISADGKAAKTQSLPFTGERTCSPCITINKDDWNAENINVCIIAWDNKCGKSTELSNLKKLICIDTNPPEIEVTYLYPDSNKNIIEHDKYYKERRAKITITERNHHFIQDIGIKVEREKDTEEKPYTDLNISSNGDTHTGYIDFAEEGNYTLIINPYKDLAGNTTVAQEYHFTIDKTAPEVTAEVIEPVENKIYNRDVQVSLTAKDTVSNIASVTYTISANGKAAKSEEILIGDKREWDGIVTVNAKDWNADNVKVSVVAKDKWGNTVSEGSADVTFNIDIIAPIIFMTGLEEGQHGTNFSEPKKTAYINITERNSSFDKSEVQITVDTANENSGASAQYNVNENNWKSSNNTETTSDDDVQTVDITFSGDAVYMVTINYKDKAGNVAQEAKYVFTLDTTAPTGTVSVDGNAVKWNSLLSSVFAEVVSNRTVFISGTANDVTSGLKEKKYYKSRNAVMLSKTELDNLEEASWEDFENRISIVSNEWSIIYMRMIDYAGNVSYVSTNGIIVDETKPDETVAPNVTIAPEQPVNGIYNNNVSVAISVEDPQAGNTYSGIRSVSYKIYNMGVETRRETLYNFNNNSPSFEELVNKYNTNITVNAADNNSNDVVVEVTAVDNAGNEFIKSTVLKIDVTAPVINISYDNNTPDSNEYYNANRTATITITERNFSEDGVTVEITNTDGNIPEISRFTETAGSGNGDDKTYTASIVYSEDGDYTFNIGFSDMAGNRAGEANYAANTANASEFTIDKTLPVVNVAYDNNNVANNLYFNANRTATIEVTEHNFDVARVQFTQTAAIDGQAIEIPQAVWNSNGDVHTATIAYTADGDYTFDVTVSDMAGNNCEGVNYGNSAASQEFTIDTAIEAPMISGVENGKAYKGEAVPFISFNDINYDTSSYVIKLYRTRKGSVRVDVTNEYIPVSQFAENALGGSSSYANIPQLIENDGIYELEVLYKDKAGNEQSQAIKFSVNRFGSVYSYDESFIALNGRYLQSVTNELVVTEYNADMLMENSVNILITRDGTPLQNVAYTVSPQINTEVNVGESGWYQYEYRISPSNFAEDGVYKISISSEDMAGNRPETANSDEGDILFRIDTTSPEFPSITGLEENLINADSHTVSFTAFDAMGLKRIAVYVNGEETELYENFEDIINFSGSFTMGEGTEQTVRFVAEDLAGNVLDTDERDGDGYVFDPGFSFNRIVTISTNFFVRFINNPPALYGTIGGVAAAGGGAASMVILRRRKLKLLKKGKAAE